METTLLPQQSVSNSQSSQQLFASPAKDSAFHKIGAGNGDGMHLNSTCTNSLNKVPSLSSISSAWRKTSILSSVTGLSRFRSERPKSSGFVPHVSLAGLIKKKAHLYHDESLAYNFDDVLENGYNIVLEKKNERANFREEQQKLRNEIDIMDKEVLPVMNRYFTNKEQLKYHDLMYEKYVNELEEALHETGKMQGIVDKREKDVEALAYQLLGKMRSLDNKRNTLKNEVSNNKVLHKQQLVDIQDIIRQNQARHQRQIEALNKVKSEYNGLLKAHSDKKRKMENKSKMFLGILKH